MKQLYIQHKLCLTVVS